MDFSENFFQMPGFKTPRGLFFQDPFRIRGVVDGHPESPLFGAMTPGIRGAVTH